LIPVEQDPLLYGHSTDKSIVAAFQVLKAEAVALLMDKAVATGYKRIEERDVVGGIAAYRDFIGGQGKQLSLERATDCLQPCPAGSRANVFARIAHDAMSIPAGPARSALDT
jgi:hypothetical protein